MNFRKDIEELKNSPEFIKVAYDKYGNPIGVRPANGHDITEEKSEKPSTKMNVQTLHYDTKMIGQWLGVINQNMHTLREQIALLENPTDKFTIILQDAISKNMDFTSKQIDLMSRELQNYKILSNSIMDQLNLVNENFSLLRKEISDNSYISRQIIAEMDMIKNEVRNSNSPSSEIINMLNSMNENFEILRSRVMEISRETAEMNNQLIRKLSDVVSTEDISSIYDKFSEMATKRDISELSAKVSNMDTSEDFSEMATKKDISDLVTKFSDLSTKEDLDMVISGFISKQEFHEVNNELKEMIMKGKIDKDELVSELMNKIKLLLKKPKRKIRAKKIVKKKIVRKIRKKRTKTILKSTIRKFLLRKFNLTENERVLVVTDKKMEKIGNKIYETCRKINESTVFLVMENMKKSGQEPEDSVSEAMKNTDAIIGVTFYTLKKTDALRNAVELGARACLISKSMKFSVAK